MSTIYQFQSALNKRLSDQASRKLEQLVNLPKTLAAEALALQFRECQGYLQAISDAKEIAKDAEQEAYGEKGK